MDTLLGIIEEVIEATMEDALSPIPGFFTLLTIARLVSASGYEGKGKDGTLSPRQVKYIKNILNQRFEIRISGRTKVYGRRTR